VVGKARVRRSVVNTNDGQFQQGMTLGRSGCRSPHFSPNETERKEPVVAVAPQRDEGVRGGAEGETYHAAAAGAGAACEGALLIAPTSGTPTTFEDGSAIRAATRPTTRLPTSQAEERMHRKPKPGQRSEAVAKASDGRAQPRAQWSRFGLSGACAGCRQARHTSGGARTGVGRGRRGAHAAPALVKE
jgi:hypothetical protein